MGLGRAFNGYTVFKRKSEKEREREEKGGKRAGVYFMSSFNVD